MMLLDISDPLVGVLYSCEATRRGGPLYIRYHDILYILLSTTAGSA